MSNEHRKRNARRIAADMAAQRRKRNNGCPLGALIFCTSLWAIRHLTR